MRPIPIVIVLYALAAVGVAVPPGAAAQGVTTATLSGTVTGSTGQPVRGALVTLSGVGSSGAHETTTDAGGAFVFGLLAPGSYEIRAEALGYRPVLARTLVLSGGDRAHVPLTINASAPPILTVDTVALAASVSGRWSAGSSTLGAGEIDGLPFRDEDLAQVSALSSPFDGALGSQGLPGSMTLLIVDGVPVYRAPHPLARAERASFAAFPRSSLGALSTRPHAGDVEASGAAGAYLFATTRSGPSVGGLSLGGAWSGGPLWSSSELDISGPTLTSFQADGRASLEASPTSTILVSADAFQSEAPLGPRVAEAVAPTLAGLDTELIATLSRPSLERFQRFSTSVRFDSQQSASGYFFLRGAVGYAKREFEGPGPVTLARDAALPEESVDFSVAAGLVREQRRGLVFDFRMGVSGSSRTFDPATGGMPSATLAASGTRLGVVFGGAGESSRVDGVLLPAIRWNVAGGTLKLGLPLRVSTHTVHREGLGDFFYSDGPALVAGQGFATVLRAPEADFVTREFGVFAQYEFEPSPGVQTFFGVRLDQETAPGGEATLNSAWLQAAGLANDDYPKSFTQFGARASLLWDPSADGSTRLFGSLGVHHGDLDAGLLGELFSQDTEATSTRYAGSGLSWPAGTLPSGATARPTITLFGPDARAPRSAHASAGIARRLVGAVSLHLEGAYRRTDFLMRRRNLNRALTPQAADPNGRDVFGTLQQSGALVTATADDARRFPAFEAVWALDPDGWSEYAGATVALQYSTASSGLAIAYTRSRTTDNWIGAARGHAGAELSPALPGSGGAWAEGVSDFDVPDRVSATGTTAYGPLTLSAVYRYRSGLPFTPRYRDGVDANGDGSYRNDVAFVDATLVDPLLAEWPCLSGQVGGFAVRNSCRGPAAHALDVRLRVSLGSVMGREASLVLDGFDLIESGDGVVDDALLLVDPASTLTTAGGVVTIPLVTNPGFGRVLYPATRGRMLRVGFRIG